MPVGDSGGFFLSLVTESFAVRALLDSLAAAVGAALAIAFDLVKTSRARRLMVLGPVLTTAVAAVASIGEVYLPQLWITTTSSGAAGHFVDLLGEFWLVAADGPAFNPLVGAYGLAAAVLLFRRALGYLVVRRLLRRARPPEGFGYLVPVIQRLSAAMEISEPRLLLLPHCPGGAFTVCTLRPVVAADPALISSLDERELEGLLAHELAHIHRRDTLIGLLVGIFRDLTFFLPPVHVAARWLRNEQEEGADEVASAHTGRPVALASSILKVWDASCGRRGLSAVCAAAPGRRLAVAGGGSLDGDELSNTIQAITARVERLIEQSLMPSHRRRRVEVVAAASAVVVAASAALVVPSWVASGYDADSLSFVALAQPSAPPPESPAFATFRKLAPERPTLPQALAEPAAVASFSAPVPQSAQGECRCVETRAQLRAGTAAGADDPPRMLWHSPGRDSWQVDHLAAGHSVRPARPLWTLTDSGPHVGFFLLGSTTS